MSDPITSWKGISLQMMTRRQDTSKVLRALVGFMILSMLLLASCARSTHPYQKKKKKKCDCPTFSQSLPVGFQYHKAEWIYQLVA